jgi:hypothetical protein
MLKKFSTKQLVFIALVAAFMLLIDLLVVAPINSFSGVSGMGFLIDVIFINAIVTFVAIILKKVFSITLVYTLFGILVIPTSVLGPPTPFKIILGAIIGLTADFIIWIFGYKKAGYIFGVAVANAISYPVGLFFAVLLGLPGTEALSAVVWYLTATVLILGLFGDYLGMYVHKKLKDKNIVRQLRD